MTDLGDCGSKFVYMESNLAVGLSRPDMANHVRDTISKNWQMASHNFWQIFDAVYISNLYVTLSKDAFKVSVRFDF